MYMTTFLFWNLNPICSLLSSVWGCLSRRTLPLVEGALKWHSCWLRRTLNFCCFHHLGRLKTFKITFLASSLFLFSGFSLFYLFYLCDSWNIPFCMSFSVTLVICLLVAHLFSQLFFLCKIFLFRSLKLLSGPWCYSFPVFKIYFYILFFSFFFFLFMF